MKSTKLCRTTLLRFLVVLALISSFLALPVFAQETEDSQIFITGFNAYQQKNYSTAIARLDEVLQKYPDTPLRDMTLFWLARAHYKSGHRDEAARVMAQFSREFPDSPLKGTVEEELLALAAQYDKTSKPTAAVTPAQPTDQLAEAARTKAGQERSAAAKAEEERNAATAAESRRLAALKAEEARQAALKLEQERLAAEKAEQQRIAAEKTEQQRIAALKAEQARLAALKAEEERSAAEAERQRLAALKAEEDRLTAEKAEQDRLAAERAAAEAEAARQAAEAQEQARTAAARAEERRLNEQREAAEKDRIAKAELREKAIAQYKSVIQTYPASQAAASAAARLREMGVAVPVPTQPAVEPQAENAQVLSLEVAQYAGFDFNLLTVPQAYDVARRISIPFEITNRGNGSDSFYLESGFPRDFNAAFAAADAPEQVINQTPALAPNESFKGIVTLAIPATSIDGLRIAHPVKAASRFTGEVTQSREIQLTAAAPLLRAVLKVDKSQVLPGDKIQYRVAVLNVGSTAAQNVSLRLSFPPQLEPLDHAAAGFTQEMKAALVRDGLQIKSGESKEFTVAFLVKDDSLAGQELICRAELVNNQLKTGSAFVSSVANIKATHGIQVRSASGRIVIIPGQTVALPFVVTNTGNVREKFAIAASVTGAPQTVVFHDLNRDGLRQAGEPVITEIGPLEPKEETSIVMEISTPRSAADASEGSAQITFLPEGDAAKSGTATASLVYSRPVLQMAMTGRDGCLKPGDVASFDLAITNRGSNLARVVDLQSAWPEQLELIAAEPANSSAAKGSIAWKFNELGAGEKRIIKVSFRVKPGTGVGTSLQVKTTLKYEDQLGHRY